MRLKLSNRHTGESKIIKCKSVDILGDAIIIILKDNTVEMYHTDDYEPELLEDFAMKIKDKWSELTKPCPDEELLEDAVKYLCDILCIIEAIPDDESRVEYLRYIFKHADKWQEDEINELIHIAM